MKKFLQTTLLVVLISLTGVSSAQKLTTVPDGGNRKAAVSEIIGITKVSINYNRPGVKGREGKIWGGLVPYGYNDLGFGTSKAAPWRAGANENTTFEFSTDVKIEGKDLAAGKYAFFIALTDPKDSNGKGGDATLIFSKNATSWGSFFYKPEEDALRVTVKTEKTAESVEWLTYAFTNQTDNSATVALTWEKLKIPFKIEVDVVKTQVASFRKELRSDVGFQWQSWVEAANFCVANNTNLEEALTWSEYGITGVFIGQKNFQTLACKASVLDKLGRKAEADALMKEAAPLGSMNEIHNYARTLLREKRAKEAFEIFKLNSEKNPNTFTTNMGMMRAYSAVGDYKKALEFAQKSLPQAPDPGNKVNVETCIKKLQEGKDVN